jgi:hypothetical protein
MKKINPLKSNKHRLIVSLLISLALCSCNKDKGPSKEEINESLLTGTDSKTWLIVSSTINGVESLPNCVKDDFWTFKKSKQVTRQNQTTSCTNGIPDNQTSTWSFGNDGEWLTFFGGTYEILSLTETKMKLRFPRTGEEFIDTFVKK